MTSLLNLSILVVANILKFNNGNNNKYKQERGNLIVEEKAKKLARQLKVLANENRLLILYYLLEKPMTVGELNKKLSNITQSGLSQHLSILKAHDLLDSNKDGLNITYFVKDKKIHSILKMLKENYGK